MRLEDLSPGDRKAVERAIGRKSSTKERTRARPSRAEAKAAPGEVDRGGSCSCGERLPSYNAWEKHQRANPGPAHGRWSIEFTVTPRPEYPLLHPDTFPGSHRP